MTEFERLRDLAVVVRRQAIPEVVAAVKAGTIDLDVAFRISSHDRELQLEMMREAIEPRELTLLEKFGQLWASASMEEKQASAAGIAQAVGIRPDSPQRSDVKPSEKVLLGATERKEPTEEEFASFYRAFPRRVNKAKSRIAFAKAVARLRKSMTVELAIATIMKGVAIYAARANPDALCHPTTWLNGDRWEDEPEGIGPSERRFGTRNHSQLGKYVERDCVTIEEAVF